jgi:hypothetical protein
MLPLTQCLSLFKDKTSFTFQVPTTCHLVGDLHCFFLYFEKIAICDFNLLEN